MSARLTPKQRVLKRFPNAVCKRTFNMMFGIVYEVREKPEFGRILAVSLSASMAWAIANMKAKP